MHESVVNELVICLSEVNEFVICLSVVSEFVRNNALVINVTIIL